MQFFENPFYQESLKSGNNSLEMISILSLPQEKLFWCFFFRPTHPGKERQTVGDTCRQGKARKTLATNINGLLKL